MIDCADPSDLARFYSELLGLSVTYEEDDRAVIAVNDTTSGWRFNEHRTTSRHTAQIRTSRSSSTWT
jgi:catechol-2,3-dioxygenase